MLVRAYFSRSLTCMLRERPNGLFSRSNFEFTRTFVQKSAPNVLQRTGLFRPCSNVLCPRTGLAVRSQAFPLVSSLRFYQRSSASSSKSWKGRLLNIVRGVFLVTGGLVWLVVVTAYAALDRVTVDVLENENLPTANALQKKLAEHFYQEKNAAGILRKDTALDHVWQKLCKEERMKEIFGEPLFICGHNFKFRHDAGEAPSEQMGEGVTDVSLQKVDDGKTEEQVEQESEILENEVDDTVWEAGCYIEGPKKMGLMKVKFEKWKQEWVPVALNLETLEKTGNVISNVSGPLPNGIKNFTRLSN